MARNTVIHHPELKRQTKVGPGFAKALIRDGGWKAGPLPDGESTDTPKKKAAKKTASS